MLVAIIRDSEADASLSRGSDSLELRAGRHSSVVHTSTSLLQYGDQTRGRRYLRRRKINNLFNFVNRIDISHLIWFSHYGSCFRQLCPLDVRRSQASRKQREFFIWNMDSKSYRTDHCFPVKDVTEITSEGSSEACSASSNDCGGTLTRWWSVCHIESSFCLSESHVVLPPPAAWYMW